MRVSDMVHRMSLRRIHGPETTVAASGLHVDNVSG